MKLIKPSFEIIEQKEGLEGIYEQIELAGRTCYKSIRPEGKTAKDFVDNLIKRKHGGMLEHATIYLNIPFEYKNTVSKYLINPYTKYAVLATNSGIMCNITTNYRVIIENGWEKDLQYLCKPTEQHNKRVTVRFIISNGIAREFCRHRVFSFAQESSRYCNYSKDKFNNSLTFIQPSWFKHDFTNKDMTSNEAILSYTPLDNFAVGEELILQDFIYSEFKYLQCIATGLKPQQAREVLPLGLKTELVMTGFIDDWKHFFDLRYKGITGAPHPDAKIIVEPLYKEFIKRGYIKEEV